MVQPEVQELLNEGIECNTLNQPQTALGKLNQAIAIQPDVCDGYMVRATTWQNLQNWEQSIADCNQALLLLPTTKDTNMSRNPAAAAMVYAKRGITNAMAGNRRAAVTDFNIALNIHPSDSTADAIGSACIMYHLSLTGQFPEGVGIVTHSLGSDPLSFLNAEFWISSQEFWASAPDHDLIYLMQHNPEVVVSLLKVRDTHTILHLALGQDRPLAVIKMMTDLNPDVNTPNHNGNTPLHIAGQSCSRPEVVETLLDLGADITLVNKNRLTPFWSSVQWGKHPGIRQMLYHEDPEDHELAVRDLPWDDVVKRLQTAYYRGLEHSLNKPSINHTAIKEVAKKQASKIYLSESSPQVDPREFIREAEITSFAHGRGHGTKALKDVTIAFYPESMDPDHPALQRIANDQPNPMLASMGMTMHIVGSTLQWYEDGKHPMPEWE